MLGLSGAGMLVFALLVVIFHLTDQLNHPMPVRIEHPNPVKHVTPPNKAAMPFVSGPPPEIGIDNGY